MRSNLTRKLVLASAGSGKSTRIVDDAIELVKQGQKVLVITYTEKNQAELVAKFVKRNGAVPTNVIIKGWFTFLLQDMIRPYQTCLFPDRIAGIYFVNTDPHKDGKWQIPGRKELVNDEYNPKHFFTTTGKVYTSHISKLATRVGKSSNGSPTDRLQSIYNAIFIDEVQDLVGWDYELLMQIAKSELKFLCCAGDFRQTLYNTHTGAKTPKSVQQKKAKFAKLKFVIENQNNSYRCTQAICDFADLVHKSEDYRPTVSELKDTPDDHVGVFAVRLEHVEQYMQMFQPVVLRTDRTTQTSICKGYMAYNFGVCKGLTFDRVLICTTKKQGEFLSGKHDAFSKQKTPVAQNRLYVAITRARYSVAFLYDGVCDDSIVIWRP